MDCPFCPPSLDSVQVLIENEHCRFLQQSEPILVGSGLVIPKQHRTTVFDLTTEEWQSTWSLLQHVKVLLDQQFAPDGYNIGWNCGAAAGQEIFHAHLHVIPRYMDEPLAGKGIRYWLKQEANRRISVTRTTKLPGESLRVQIQIKGQIDQDWSEWLNGFAITYLADNNTLLTGCLPDQPALYGLLVKLRNLGLSLVSINSVLVEV